MRPTSRDEKSGKNLLKDWLGVWLGVWYSHVLQVLVVITSLDYKSLLCGIPMYCLDVHAAHHGPKGLLPSIE